MPLRRHTCSFKNALRMTSSQPKHPEAHTWSLTFSRILNEKWEATSLSLLLPLKCIRPRPLLPLLLLLPLPLLPRADLSERGESGAWPCVALLAFRPSSSSHAAWSSPAPLPLGVLLLTRGALFARLLLPERCVCVCETCPQLYRQYCLTRNNTSPEPKHALKTHKAYKVAKGSVHAH